MIDPRTPDEATPELTPRLLREFAGLCLLCFGVLFALSAYRHSGHPNTTGWIVGAVALAIGIPGLIHPAVVRPIYLVAHAVTRPIGQFVGLGLLAFVYYGLITPLALVFRVLGRDSLGLRRRDTRSYWVPRRDPGDVRRYLRQFQQQSGVPNVATPSRTIPSKPGTAVPDPTPASGARHGTR